MSTKKILLDDTTQLIEEKKSNFQKITDKKQPLLQIIFKNNKKGKNSDKNSYFHNSPKISKINSSFNYNLSNKESEKNIKEKNDTPIKKIKNIRYILNNDQLKKDEDLYTYIKSEKINGKQNKFKFNSSRNLNKQNNSKKNTISISLNNNSLFPTLNEKTNLFRLQKKGKENTFEEKTKQNDIAYKNINLKNLNSNSIIVTESRPKKFTLLQKFLGDKILNQKSMNFNTANIYKNLNSEESFLKKISNIRINSEINDKNNNIYESEKKNKSNISNKFNYNFNLEGTDLNKKVPKAKSLKFNNIRNMNNIPLKTENYPEFKKKKEFLSLVPRNDNIHLKSSMMKTLSQEKSTDSPKEENKDKRKIYFLKQNLNENDILNKILKPLKSNLYNMNNKNNENVKTINYTNKKDINHPLDKLNNPNINKSNDNETNNGIDYFDSSKKINKQIKLFQHNKSYIDADAKKFVEKDEEKYFKSKRLKMIEKVKENNKLSESYRESRKKYFIKNKVIDDLNKKILDNEILLKLREEVKKEKLRNMQKYLKEIFNYILNLPNVYHPYEKEDKFGLCFYKEEPINTKIIVRDNFEFFDMYPELVNDIDDIWNKKNESNYKELMEYYSFGFISKDKKKIKFFETTDRKYFLFKERIRKDINLYIDSINFSNASNKENIKVKKDNKSNEEIKNITNNTFKTKKSSKIVRNFIYRKSKTLNLSKEEMNQLINIARNNCVSSKNILRDEEIDKNQEKEGKQSKLSKFKKDLMPNQPKKSQKRLSIYNLILPQKSKKNINNSKDEKDPEKEIAFKDANEKIQHYNILTNMNIFHNTKKKENKENKKNDLDGKEKLKEDLSKNLKRDKINKKFSGTGESSYETSANKEKETRETDKEIDKDKDLPRLKLFNEFVSILKRKEIDKFYFLLHNNENNFNEIINKQEYSTGNTLLIYASENNLKSIVEFLLIKGANPNIQNVLGNTALHIAYQKDNSFLINLLFEYHADIEIKNIKGFTPQQME